MSKSHVWVVEVQYEKGAEWLPRPVTHRLRAGARFIARLQRSEGIAARVRKYSRTPDLISLPVKEMKEGGAS